MVEEDDSHDDSRSFTGTKLNRIIALLFVLGIYLIMFLKILVLP